MSDNYGFTCCGRVLRDLPGCDRDCLRDDLHGESPMKAVVYGPIASMGSKRAFVVKGRAVLVDQQSKKLRTFQESVREAMRDSAPESPLLGPIAFHLAFYMRRPKGHFGTGKHAAMLKESAPALPTSKPDIDKVARAAIDCGSGLWYRDDAQIVRLLVEKFYTSGEERCEVEARGVESGATVYEVTR